MLLTILIGLFTGYLAVSTPVEVEIINLRSNKGQVVLGIFKDDASFQKEQPFLSKAFKKTVVEQGKMLVNLELEPGVYGISMLDDENGDHKMNYSFIGIPKEGFGFSNYYHKGFSKPSMEAFKIQVTKAGNNRVQIKIRYM